MEAELRAGLAALGLELSDHQVGQLISYAALLQKWGRTYNLTALLGADEIVRHHLLDSLAILQPMRKTLGSQPQRLLDVGSGAGLPGVVVAIANPETHVDCLDAVAKKAAFVQQAAGALGLPNLRGVHARVEAWREKYPVVTSRAFASLPDFVKWSVGVLDEGGVWLALKGKYPSEEVAALPPDVEMFHVEQLSVPGLDADRCLVWMRRARA